LVWQGVHAPILLLPGTLPPELCEALVRHYDRDLPVHASDGFTSPGYGREPGEFKVRHEAGYGRMTELVLLDPALVARLDGILRQQVIPRIAEAFRGRIGKREPWRIAGYEAPDGFVGPHTDAATEATRGRNFTVTVNLNAGEYEGGDLRFPTFADGAYAVERGTGIVWAATLRHEVLPVTRGRRFILGVHLRRPDRPAGAPPRDSGPARAGQT